jgi:hypothetical protein
LGTSRQSGPGRLDSVEGIRLSLAAAGLAVGPVDLDDFDTPAAEEPREPSAIGTCALHADLGDQPEAFEPAQQLCITGRGRLKGLRTEQCSNGVESSGNVDIEVGIDSTRHGSRSFYDGHSHPFLP